MTTALRVDADNLNDVMTFGHVIEVMADGTVRDSDEYGPEALYVSLDEDGQMTEDAPDMTWDWCEWELLQGFTGQYGYNGPIMHPSEFIGGGLARYILENPGLYVAVIIDGLMPDADGEPEPVGWAVAYKPSEPEGEAHVGHRSHITGAWFCDTCNSPYCELA